MNGPLIVGALWDYPNLASLTQKWLFLQKINSITLFSTLTVPRVQKKYRIKAFIYLQSPLKGKGVNPAKTTRVSCLNKFSWKNAKNTIRVFFRTGPPDKNIGPPTINYTGEYNPHDKISRKNWLHWNWLGFTRSGSLTQKWLFLQKINSCTLFSTLTMPKDQKTYRVLGFIYLQSSLKRKGVTPHDERIRHRESTVGLTKPGLPHSKMTLFAQN